MPLTSERLSTIMNAIQFVVVVCLESLEHFIMGTRQRRQREAEGRRRAILDAARALFWRHGYAVTTMPAIAAAAELAPGTLYLYFPSKSALYVELLIEGYEALRTRLQAAAGAGRGTPMHRLIDAFFAFAREHPEYFRIIFFLLQSENALGREAALSPDQLQRLTAMEADCKEIALLALRDGDTPPPSRRGQRDVHRIDALWAMLAGVVFFWGSGDSFDAVAGEARALILNALNPQP